MAERRSAHHRKRYARTNDRIDEPASCCHSRSVVIVPVELARRNMTTKTFQGYPTVPDRFWHRAGWRSRRLAVAPFGSLRCSAVAPPIAVRQSAPFGSLRRFSSLRPSCRQVGDAVLNLVYCSPPPNPPPMRLIAACSLIALAGTTRLAAQ